MGIKPSAMLSGALYLSLVACAPSTYPETTSFADPDVITGFVRIFEGVCKKEIKAKPASERQELAETLSYNNMSVDEFCECSGQTIFESFTEKDLDQFVRDSSKYGKSIAEYEPWKTRFGRDILRCVTGNWPSKSVAREITPPKPSITDGSVPESSLPATYRDKRDIKVYARHPSGMTWTESGWHSVRAAMENAHFKCQRRYGDPCTVVYVGPFRLAVMSEETREQTLMAYEEAHRAYRARNRIYGALIVLARDNLDDDNTAVISPAPTRTELAIRVDVGNTDEIDAVFSQLEQAGMIEWRDNSLIVPNVEALSLALRSDSAGVRMETEQKVGELKRILREAQASQPNQ